MERPVAHVPRWIVLLLVACIAAQMASKAGSRPPPPVAEDLPPPPHERALRVAALSEPVALSRLMMLYLQSFDYHGSNAAPYRNLDYTRLTGWLAAIQRLDERSGYPLFIAARIYAEVPDPKRQRLMLEFVYEQFLLDPDRRWEWAAHAALVAKHRLKDLPLAMKYARAVDQLTTAPGIPLWAKQMEIFILEDLNELDAARIMLGGLLASGRIGDPGERKFLEGRLKELEARLKGPAR